jgi:hypothetical protein
MALANLNNPETIAHYDFAFVKPLDEKELHTILKPLKDYYNRRRCYKRGFEVQFLSLQPKTSI